MKLLPFLFSCVYSGVKLFVFAIKIGRRYSIFVWFIYGLEEKNSNSFLPFAVNVKLNLSNDVKVVVSSQLSITWYKSAYQKIGIRTVYES